MKVNVKDGKFDVKVCERWDVKVDVKNVKVFLSVLYTGCGEENGRKT